MSPFDVMNEVFGAELDTIKPSELTTLWDDFSSACNECSGREYARRIGKGNLRAYVDCLMVKTCRSGMAV